MNKAIIKATNAVAIADDADPFDAFADAVAPQYIVGKLLKFSKAIGSQARTANLSTRRHRSSSACTG